jgi:hypothetical protein
MNARIEELNRLSLPAFYRLFASLSPPPADSLRGLFQGVFVGPGWLRPVWGPLLSLAGMGGWWGKEIAPDGSAINLVLHHGVFERRFPMFFVQQTSYLDRQPGLALRYRPGCPFPWPFITDELRQIEPGLVLGMTLADLGPLRWIAFPFTLAHREHVDGL